MTVNQFAVVCFSTATIFGIMWSSYILPFIKAKIDEAKFDKFIYFVTVAVRCAEQLYTPEQWRDKKQYVLRFATLMLGKLNIQISESELDAIIEGIVNEIKHGGSED